MNQILDETETKTKKLLIRLQQEAPQDGLSHGLAQYMLERRPFALATQSAQDFNNPTNRLLDLVCGSPFTSCKHPWPKDNVADLWMQPILQLNLTTLKDVFQVDWGTGLLQVWARIARDWESLDLNTDPLMIRIVPAADTSDHIEIQIPNWRGDGDAKFFSFFDDSSFTGKEVFSWYRAGEMYGTRQQLLDFCYDKVDDFGDDEFEWLDSVIDSIADSLLCGEGYSDFLGGWGGSHGEKDAAYGDGLVMRISDGEGAVVAVHRHQNKSSGNDFIASFSLR